MKQDSPQRPLIIDLYEKYLVTQDSTSLARQVAARYTVATLERLTHMGDRLARRAAVLAIGYLGDYGSNGVLGRSLNDNDRGVRTLAENGIRRLWTRQGSNIERGQLATIARLNSEKRYDEAIAHATRLIRQSPWFAEAWNQRALAHFNCGRYDDALRDCHQTLEINSYHFPAATGMGKCYLQLNNPAAALECFRRALRLNPGLDDVRAHVVYLQRTLKEES